MACALNMSLPVNASCAGGATAFACTCDAAAFCCDDDDDCACLGRDGGDELFSFSWPLVAGWYAMLVVLFCVGRRGRFAARLCGRRAAAPAAAAPAAAPAAAAAPPPSVRTRRLAEGDERGDACTICLGALKAGDAVAMLPRAPGPRKGGARSLRLARSRDASPGGNASTLRATIARPKTSHIGVGRDRERRLRSWEPSLGARTSTTRSASAHG